MKMPTKINIDDDFLLIREMAHKFQDYVIKKRIADKIYKKMKEFHIGKGRETEKYNQFLKREFEKWAKNKIEGKYLDSVWEHYLQD